MLKQRYLGVSLALALLLSGGLAAWADNAGPTEPDGLSKLQTMVGNLGYTTSLDSDKQAFAIEWHGDYDYRLHFDLSKDGTLAYAYVNVNTYKPADLAKLNLTKLLETSDIGDFYFSMENSTDGESLYANAIIPLAGLTPQSLRAMLESINDKLSSSSQIWDTSLWKK
ncbi:hypothetical protein [Acidocella aromatica]|uniref:Rhodanese domain-containing protein n=1 Tax=Acidocella aromatica TaxID=1303579 RepID=A0A840VB55_9PROT|nr:hypothetical protein [Acidocella aromatica]MBB5372067.1 hypothetical protein [Acidocella aromatica]